MALTSGARIGIYEVIVQLGAGGMGEVYRARDTRLDRDVALKILPPLFTSDPERVARFEREAKVLASLNHPNIAQVYGFEANAIAMELVEGPTLEEIIRNGGPGLQLEEALVIARQIATALEVAHDQGIVHRDLKPANVKVREDGTVKVLDFGLAKALANDGDGGASSVSNSPTLTARSTQLGMILGTAAYMAPEQAKGRSVDRRADVWAFGVVLFEMLSGRRAFEGDDVSDVLASVLKSDPDWSVLPADVPAPVRRFLRRCFEKDPKKRLRDIGEGMLQLEEGLAAGPEVRSSKFEVQTSAKPVWRRTLPVAAAVVLTAGAVAGGMRWLTPEPARPEPVQFQYTPQQRLFFSVAHDDVAIAPDGRLVAYTVLDNLRPPGLHLKRLDQVDGTPLRGAENALLPFFSPDGGWVGFLDQANQSTLKKVSVLGGPPVQVTVANATVLGATWIEGGSIIFGTRAGGLYRVADAGGTPQALTSLEDKDQVHMWPSGVPGTPLVLFTIVGLGTTPTAGGLLAAVDVTTGRVTRLKVPGTHPRHVSSGHIVYASADGSLRAVPFDTGRVAVTGDPIPVVEGVGIKGSGASNFDVSRNGHLVHTTGGTGSNTQRTLVWTDRAGRETPIAAPKRNYFYARIAPDGGSLSLDIRDEELDIWIWDLKRETLSRLTDTPGSDAYGLWMPDGRVVFSSTTGGRQEVYYHRVDGVGAPQQITDTAAGKLQPFPNAVTPDGKQLVFRAAAAGGKNDLFLASIGGDKSYKPLLDTEHDEYNVDFSKDGRFFVFISDHSGRPEIYVRPFPDVNGGQWPVSTAGGTEPVWSKTGREIFYLAPDGKLMAVPVDTTKGVTLGKPQVLFDASAYFFGAIGRNYDASADGKRFIMVKDIRTPGEVRSNPLTIVLNWVERLKAK
jgi:Tol biopolymer transport system component/predicted Ser/Thr protein kinase